MEMQYVVAEWKTALMALTILSPNFKTNAPNLLPIRLCFWYRAHYTFSSGPSH